MRSPKSRTFIGHRLCARHYFSCFSFTSPELKEENIERQRRSKPPNWFYCIRFFCMLHWLCCIISILSVGSKSYWNSHEPWASYPQSLFIWLPVSVELPPGAWSSLSSKTTHSHFGQHFLRKYSKFLSFFLNGLSVIREVHSSFWASASSCGKLSNYPTCL